VLAATLLDAYFFWFQPPDFKALVDALLVGPSPQGGRNHLGRGRPPKCPGLWEGAWEGVSHRESRTLVLYGLYGNYINKIQKQHMLPSGYLT